MPGGRPTKFDDERADKIVDAIREGNTMETAARTSGVAPSTVYLWQSERPEFLEAIQRARAVSEKKLVAQVVKAAEQTWKPAAWLLERRNPRAWGLRIQVEVRRQIDDFLDYLQEKLDAETFERVRLVALAFGEDPGEVGSAEFERPVLAAVGVDPEAPAGLPEPDASAAAPGPPRPGGT